MFFQDKIYSA